MEVFGREQKTNLDLEDRGKSLGGKVLDQPECGAYYNYSDKCRAVYETVRCQLKTQFRCESVPYRQQVSSQYLFTDWLTVDTIQIKNT